MATIHINEIIQILREKGYPEAERGQFFVEILFTDEQKTRHALSVGAVDPEWANQRVPVDAPQSNVLIVFDEAGMLRSLELG